VRFGNQSTIRRMGYLLDIMGQPPLLLDRLKSSLRQSKALIAWVPTRPKRGQVNREWGLIVNG